MKLLEIKGGEFLVDKRVKPLLADFFDQQKTLLFVGAGISLPAGIPAGSYFKRGVQELTGNKSNSWKVLAKALRENREAYMRLRTMFMSISREADPTLTHKLIIDWWMRKHVYGVVTTNWDFLLEKAWERTSRNIQEKKDFFMCYSREDLDYAEKTEKKYILYKIHGNPLFHTCPACKGVERFKFVDPEIDIHGKLFCSVHHKELSDPAMILPTEHVDHSQKEVWNHVLNLGKKANQILVMGYRGDDKYIFDEFMKPNREKLYVIKPIDKSPVESLVGNDRLFDEVADNFSLGLGLIEEDSWEATLYGNRPWWKRGP